MGNYYEFSDIDPYNVLESFNDDEYEKVVGYWIQGFLNNEKTYLELKIHPKGKDKGRDISAYYDSSRQEWDNFQCKHYKDPINPQILRQEIGKICYNSFLGNYQAPKNHYFLAPKGLSDESCTLIYNKQEQLKEDIIEKWPNDCKLKENGQKIALTPELENHIKNFDFTIFKEITQTTFLEQMQSTKYYAHLFKQSINKPMNTHPKAPEKIKKKELTYVNHLVDAYKEADNSSFTQDNIPSKYKSHFKRQRDSFYCTELVKKITEASWPDLTPFLNFKQEIYNRIISVVEFSIFTNGLEKLNACISKAIEHIPSKSNVIYKIIDEPSKQGMCHYLANKNEVTWRCNEDEI